jgi:predicted HTH domain antitoxin
MMLTLRLPPQEEQQLQQWASEQGEEVRKKADYLFASTEKPWGLLFTLFAKALTLLRPAAAQLEKQAVPAEQFALLILQTMVALYHANAGRPYTTEELQERSRLEDAMTLYDLEVVTMGMAARIAGVSRQRFIDELGKAGIPVFQYSAEEAITEAFAA